MSRAFKHLWAIQPAEQTAELVSRQPSQLALASTSGRGDLTGHHFGREGTLASLPVTRHIRSCVFVWSEAAFDNPCRGFGCFSSAWAR